MKKTKHTPEQIIRKVREAEAQLAGGVTVPEVCKQLGIGSPGHLGYLRHPPRKR